MADLVYKIIPIAISFIGAMTPIVIFMILTVRSLKGDLKSLSIEITKLTEGVKFQKELNGNQDIDIRNFTKESVKTQAIVMETLSELTSKINDRSDKIFQTKEVCNIKHAQQVVL